MEYSYKLSAIKGIQANREYYIAMVPMRMLGRLFATDEEYLLPEYRAQRRINQSRIPVIRKYILENRDTYVFSALAASIDGEFRFIPSTESPSLGTLEISMDAVFQINDGQHRKAAILEALAEDSTLRDETISIVFYADLGLERSQQMFTDLNKHAVKTSNSIAELYDSRDDLAVASRQIVAAVPFFREYTDKEKDMLGKYSSKLFTLNNIYNASKRILREHEVDEDSTAFMIDFWNTVYSHVIPWQELINKQISKVDIRENYIVIQAVMIQVLARLGSTMFMAGKDELERSLSGLEKIDWRREAPIWKYRTIRENGRVITSDTAIILTCNAIKKELGLPLDKNEQAKEQAFLQEVARNA